MRFTTRQILFLILWLSGLGFGPAWPQQQSGPDSQTGCLMLQRTLLLMYNNSYFSQKDSTDTEYLDWAYEMAIKSKDSVLICETSIDKGRSLYRSGDFLNAINYFQESACELSR